ncbi:HNH endonuclease [Paenibacillus sp. S25]|uniref:HNH endonuclease n=1 Tax=Paenibacillus sp. S25 TaxID=2823905 RepID=UPI001C646A9C|nr:HNH endonuclease [Paenibacillus sp. S25]QYK62417.1 HNH endonuclease [Paenibacillus sp. S25]
MNCYVCGLDITALNETEEHVILNSLGGRLKSKKLICRACNSQFGSAIDDRLSKQLSPIATLINVKRHRGKPQNIVAQYKDREIIVEPGGKPKLARTHVELDEKVYRIEAPSLRDARKALVSLKRNHPGIDVDSELLSAVESKEYLEKIKISMEYGGIQTKQAICKAAINYYILQGGQPTYISHLIPFVKGEIDSCVDSVKYYFPRRELFYKEENDIFHTLILFSDIKNRLLHVYIELFNEFKFIVCLSNEYEGSEVYSAYHYNLVSNEIVEYEDKLIITPKDVRRYSYTDIEESFFSTRLKLLFQRITNIMTSRKIEEISEQAMNNMLQKFPESEYEYFTKEMTDYLAKQAANLYVDAFKNRF